MTELEKALELLREENERLKAASQGLTKYLVYLDQVQKEEQWARRESGR